MNTRIVTLTLSPALDVSTETEVVTPTHKLRCDTPVEAPGGGGVNVARVAARLDVHATAVMPLGGTAGSRVADLVDAEGVSVLTIDVAESTRQSMAVTERATREQFRFVMPAPHLTSTDIAAIRAVTVDACADADVLVLSGRTPAGVDDRLLVDLARAVAPVTVLIDTSGPALEAARHSSAVLLKPSARELSWLAGRELLTEAEILVAAEAVLADSTVEALVVSIGPGGAFLARHDRPTRRLRAPTVRVRSTIGAGDSMVAGIAVGLARGLDLEQATTLGVAAGTAAVLTDGTDLCRPTDIDQLLPMVTVTDA